MLIGVNQVEKPTEIHKAFLFLLAFFFYPPAFCLIRKKEPLPRYRLNYRRQRLRLPILILAY